MAIAGSPGWSESGGPWVKPEDGMKKIIWSATRVKGGSSSSTIAKPVRGYRAIPEYSETTRLW